MHEYLDTSTDWQNEVVLIFLFLFMFFVLVKDYLFHVNCSHTTGGNKIYLLLSFLLMLHLVLHLNAFGFHQNVHSRVNFTL